MRTLHTVTAAAAAILCLLLPTSVFAQGSLTPPAPPGPTMKTLDQVEARTPISSLPYTIAAPGSYYLTGTLTAPAGSDGIIIKASNVTIDLNGFALLGPGNQKSGIYAPAAQADISISNGSIGSFITGITGDISNSRFTNLVISNNAGAGLKLTDDNEIRDCVITHNGAAGIEVRHGGLITHTVVNVNGSGGISTGDQTLVESCVVAYTARGEGIRVGYGCTVRGCTLRGNGGPGIVTFGGGDLFIGNDCDANASDGIALSGGPNSNANSVDSNTVTYNGGYGVSVSGKVNVIVHNKSRGNGAGAYSIPAGNVYGAIIDMVSAPGQISDAFGPWSNISF